MKKIILLIPLIVLGTYYSFSQTETLNKAFKALVFINGQNKLINPIRSVLKQSDYNLFIYEYNAFFNDIEKNALNYLNSRLPQDSLDYYLNEVEVLLKNINVDNVDPHVAIGTIKSRIKNLEGVPKDLKQALLYFKFYNNPGGAISNGFYEDFLFANTKNRGRKFSIKLPLFMEDRTKNSSLALSNQILNYHSIMDDHNFTIAASYVDGKYRKYSDEELEYISATNEEIRRLIPENARLITSRAVTGKNYKGILVEFDLIQEYLGLSMDTKLFYLLVFEDGQFFIFNFSYGNNPMDSNQVSLDKFRDKYHKLMLSVLNTLQFY
ncbi:MAG: hypothetical protein EAS52_15150 [Parapedobacter sp.]|nr:MAG: hypothetical protein EAS52_15150 [Parapedobacter sp.]